jgi:solute carrier family 25 uncoupling protein 27
MASEAVTFPIDITKTRLQLQGELGVTHGVVKRGALSTAVAIGREEGMAGLYRGLSPALLRHVFYTSIRIVTYEQLRKVLSEGDDPQNISVANKALIGGTSGIIGQVYFPTIVG